MLNLEFNYADRLRYDKIEFIYKINYKMSKKMIFVCLLLCVVVEGRLTIDRYIMSGSDATIAVSKPSIGKRYEMECPSYDTINSSNCLINSKNVRSNQNDTDITLEFTNANDYLAGTYKLSSETDILYVNVLITIAMCNRRLVYLTNRESVLEMSCIVPHGSTNITWMENNKSTGVLRFDSYRYGRSVDYEKSFGNRMTKIRMNVYLDRNIENNTLLYGFTYVRENVTRVYELPPPIRVVATAIADVYLDVELQMNCKHSSQISWYMKPFNESIWYFVSNSNILRIDKLTHSDNGYYRCIRGANRLDLVLVNATRYRNYESIDKYSPDSTSSSNYSIVTILSILCMAILLFTIGYTKFNNITNNNEIFEKVIYTVLKNAK